MQIKRKLLTDTINPIEINISLTSDEMNEIYNEVELQNLKIDVQRQIKDYIENNEIKNEFRISKLNDPLIQNKIIDEFIKMRDCNRAENDTWESAISNIFNRIPIPKN